LCARLKSGAVAPRWGAGIEIPGERKTAKSITYVAPRWGAGIEIGDTYIHIPWAIVAPRWGAGIEIPISRDTIAPPVSRSPLGSGD